MNRPPTLQRAASYASTLPIILVLATVGFLVTFPIQDFDIFWHLANGRAMLERGAIVNQEIFSFTSNGKPFSNHAWLAQIILFVIFKALGPNGLIAAKVMITTAIGICLYRFGRRQGLTPLPAALICLLAFGAALFRYVERPELFSSLFLALTGTLLFSYRSKALSAKILPALPLIMVLWDFMHGALYGVILLVAFMFGETLRYTLPAKTHPDAPPPMPKKQLTTLWLWVGATLALMLASPYGLRTYDIFYEFMNNNLMTSMTAEFQPTTLGEQPLFWTMLTLTAVTLLAAGRRLDLTSLCLLIPFTTLAIRYVRGIGPFSIVAAILLLVNLPPILAALTASSPTHKRRQEMLCLILLTLGMGYAIYYKLSPPPRYDSFGLGISDDGFPVGSTRFVKAENLAGNMYNTDRYGGYLAYFLFPERKIFHYNHHILFNALERYVHEPETRRQWRINYAIIGRSDEWDMFNKDGFVPIYWEPTGAVMIKNSAENQALIQRYAIRYFSPLMPKETFYQQAKNPAVLKVLVRETSDYLAQRRDQEKTDILVDLLSSQSAMPVPKRLELLGRAETYNANNPKLAAAIGSLYYQLGQQEQAAQHLKAALALAPTMLEAHFSLAYLLYDQKKFQAAADHFTTILKRTPRHPDTIYGLGLCLLELGRKQEARRSFEDYLTLVPDGPWAEKARNFLANLPLGS